MPPIRMMAEPMIAKTCMIQPKKGLVMTQSYVMLITLR